jgi:hypothetical protein
MKAYGFLDLIHFMNEEMAIVAMIPARVAVGRVIVDTPETDIDITSQG